MKNKSPNSIISKGILFGLGLGIVIVVMGGQYLCLNCSLKILDQDKIVQTLIGFYSALFTVIAVIIGIVALVGWNWLKESSEKLNKFRDFEEKLKFLNERVEFLRRKEKLVGWVKDKVDRLGLNTFELDSLDEIDRDTVKEIKKYVIKDLTDSAWLELFLAHHFMTEEEDYDRAKNVLEFIEKRDLLDEKSKIQPFLYHFLGQLNWKTYEDEYKAKFNFFNNTESTQKKPEEEEQQQAKELLEKSSKNYKKSVAFYEEIDSKNNRDYRSLANRAVVLIELYKFNLCYNNKETNQLDDARKILEDELREKDYNTYFDLARVYYYKNDDTKVKECMIKFREYLELVDKRERFKLKNKFEGYMAEEKNEIVGETKGFPGENINIGESFDSKEF